MLTIKPPMRYSTVLTADKEIRYEPQDVHYILFCIIRINLLNLIFFQPFDLRKTLLIIVFFLISLYSKLIGSILHWNMLTRL
jgi:hypothetical protein